MAALFAAVGTALGATGTAAVGTGLAASASAAGTILQAGSAVAQGRAVRSAAEFEARQMEDRANAERATASREAAEQSRRADLVISRARAVGAANGGGQDFDLIGDLAAEGDLRSRMAIWEGEEAARSYETSAAAARFDGNQRARAARTRAASTLLSGSYSLLDKYG